MDRDEFCGTQFICWLQANTRQLSGFAEALTPSMDASAPSNMGSDIHGHIRAMMPWCRVLIRWDRKCLFPLGVSCAHPWHSSVPQHPGSQQKASPKGSNQKTAHYQNARSDSTEWQTALASDHKTLKSWTSGMFLKSVPPAGETRGRQ